MVIILGQLQFGAPFDVDQLASLHEVLLWSDIEIEQSACIGNT